MNRFKYVALLIIAISLNGCISSMNITKPEFEEKLKYSPYLLDKVKAPVKQTKSEDVQLFYKSWSAFTKPNAIVDWEYHFIIEPASSPSWAYSSISDVEHYLRKMNDDSAIKTLKNMAAKYGGDALIDLHREPIIDKDTLPANIRGYKYIATIVKKEPA